MTRLSWTSREYDSGLSYGVFYPQNTPGESWTGLVSVQEAEPYSENQVRYVDGQKMYVGGRRGEFSGTIEAFTYPSSFFDDPLTQRLKKRFGLSYRVSDKIHLVYNILIKSPSHTTQQLDTDPFSWDFTTLAIPIPGNRMSAHLIIDERKAYSWTLTQLEDILYGSDTADARLPSPEEVLAIFDDNSILKVIDHGDGSFTVEGPDEAIQMLDSTTFEITWPSAVYIDTETYSISSL